MAGIIFLKTTKLAEITQFYIDRIGAVKWLSQPDIEILRHENLLIGFHQQDSADTGILLTFFYETKAEVDKMYDRFEKFGATTPKENTKYNIYNFFTKDPEGRPLEFQTFLHDLPEY